MKRGRLQAKDLDDREFLTAVFRTQLRCQQRLIRTFGREGRRDLAAFYRETLPCATMGPRFESYDDEEAASFRREYGPFLTDYYRTIPRKLLRAKAKRLIDRGLITGCVCGCRGDFELTIRGAILLHEALDPAEYKP